MQVFGSDAGQEKLYKQAIAPIVDEVMDGFNCTIFAYGQTGTGKTYTIFGDMTGVTVCQHERSLPLTSLARMLSPGPHLAVCVPLPCSPLHPLARHLRSLSR
jgi:hypothetical protein